MRWHSFVLAAILAAASCLVAAQEQAFTNRSTELKDKGAPEGRTLATLPDNTSVKVVQRSGGWTRVEASGQSGGVRAFHLRFPTGVRAFHLRFPTVVESSSSGGSMLGGLFGRPKQQQASIATTGIRGLSADDFKTANPDVAALGRLQSYRVDKGAAERFAREARLVSVSISYLMEEATSSKGRR